MTTAVPYASTNILVKHFQKQSLAILASRIEYWFLKKPDGFYKTVKRSEKDKSRNKENSWCSEVEKSAPAIYKDLKALVVHYQDKSAFDAATNVFEDPENPSQEKMYACWVDRPNHVTHYYRNHKVANAFYASLQQKYSRKKPIKPVDNLACQEKKLSSPKETFLPRCARALYSSQSKTSLLEGSVADPIPKDEERKEEISHLMKEIWMEVTNSPHENIMGTGKALFEAYKMLFGSCLKTFRAFCHKVASSKFLMGEIKKDFKAVLNWVIKQEIFNRIINGEFGIGDRKVMTSEERQLKDKLKAVDDRIRVLDQQIKSSQDEIIFAQRKTINERIESLTEEEKDTLMKDMEPLRPDDPDTINRMIKDNHLRKKLYSELNFSSDIEAPPHLLAQKNELSLSRSEISESISKLIKGKESEEINFLKIVKKKYCNHKKIMT